MAGAASWKGSIKFGPMIQFPVKAKSAVRETKFAFNMHHGDPNCLGRLAQNGYVCTGCGEVAARSESVKGYNGIAPVDEAYLDSLAFEKNPVMDLDGLVPAVQIDPRYYQKSYDVLAEKGGEKIYVLFMRLLEETDRVAIGKVVMGGKEFIVTIRPREGVLAMEVMYWPDELQSNADAKASIAGVEVTDAEMKMGRELVKFLAKDFDPEAYKNVLAEQTAAYLEALVAGQEPTPIVQKTTTSVPGGSLEEMLAASMAAMKPEPAEKGKRKKKVA